MGSLLFVQFPVLGHFVMDTTRYNITGVLGMKRFVLDYGTTHDSDGNIALTTTFISLTSSIIYVGELLGALGRCSDQRLFRRKGVFLCASACIIAGSNCSSCRSRFNWE